jgi:phage-Barnase-EndoU-ColicinE5/D-RelE like nuclease3
MIEITDEIKQRIYELHDECIEANEPFHRKLDLFIVPEYLAQKIIVATQIDVSNHWVCLDNFGIIHTLEHHGNITAERKRGQVAVVKEDFLTMLEVFLYPDEILSIGKTNKSQKPTLQFIKTIRDKIFVVKEVRTITSAKKHKVSRLIFHTMYKIRATKLA